MRNILLKIVGCTVAILCILCLSCQNIPDQKGKKTINGNKETLTFEEKDSVPGNLENINVQLSVRPNIFNTTNDTMKGVYFLSNNLDTAINFGSDYVIEKKVDNRWIKEPFVDALGFEDILFNLGSGSSKEYPLFLSKILKNTKPGEYRIIKEVWPVGEKEEKITVKAKFAIQ